jgi:hypothetical protein
MAYDTDNNVAVSGFSGEAVIATDYSASEGNHFQVMKIAYGATGEGGTRVTSSNGLPVAIVNTPTVAVSSVGGTVTVTGTVSVNQPVGVTATDLDIRTLTAGDPTTAGAISQDVVRVVGYSGGWAVGVTATNFGIRALTAGDPTTAGAVGQDVVRIVGYSGGWAIGVTAVDLDIRSLTYGSDSVSVLNTVAVSALADPFIPNPNSDATTFKTRLLRATRTPTPETSIAAIASQYLADGGNAEDTVRVVGLSGAYPVAVFTHGLTNINNYDTKIPFNVDSTGALYVNLVTGSIGVTAIVDNLEFLKIDGLSFGTSLPTSRSQVMPVHGYTGDDMVPITVTGANLDIRDLNAATDSVTAVIRVLGASGDYMALTGDALTQLNKLKFNEVGAEYNYLYTSDVNSANINNTVSTISSNMNSLNTIFTTTGSDNLVSTDSSSNKMVKVDIQRIAQPTGGTANKVAVSSGGVNTFSSVALQSGVHFRSDLNNTGTIFIGFSSAVSSQVGFPLYNGDQIFIETDNLNRIQAWSTVNGATLYYIGT